MEAHRESERQMMCQQQASSAKARAHMAAASKLPYGKEAICNIEFHDAAQCVVPAGRQQSRYCIRGKAGRARCAGPQLPRPAVQPWRLDSSNGLGS